MKRKGFAIIILTLMIIFQLTIINIYAQQNFETYQIKYYMKISNRGILNYQLTQTKNITLMVVDDYQRLRDLKVTLNSKDIPVKSFNIDENRNLIIHVPDIPSELPAKQEVEVEILFIVDLYRRIPPDVSIINAGSINDIPMNLKEKYCKLSGLWEKSLKAQEIAKTLASNKTNALEILITLIKWIEFNIRIPFVGGARMPQYPDETIDTGIGDCDDQSNLLVAMCRAIGIPAYMQFSFIYIEGRTFEDTLFNGKYKLKIRNTGGHAWARVYIPPWGWINVDMTYYTPYEIKGENMISINPLDHIRNGALYISKTVVTENFVSGDYIMDLKKWIKDLEIYNLMWEEEYLMNPHIVQVQIPFYDNIIIGALISLLTLTLVAITVYIKVSRKVMKKLNVKY